MCGGKDRGSVLCSVVAGQGGARQGRAGQGSAGQGIVLKLVHTACTYVLLSSNAIPPPLTSASSSGNSFWRASSGRCANGALGACSILLKVCIEVVKA